MANWIMPTSKPQVDVEKADRRFLFRISGDPPLINETLHINFVSTRTRSYFVRNILREYDLIDPNAGYQCVRIRVIVEEL